MFYLLLGLLSFLSWGQTGQVCMVTVVMSYFKKFFFFNRKGKTDAPKTPTTPTSPMSPSFSSAGGPLSPHLATGDSIRDKCIEMMTAALRTDSEPNPPCYWEPTTKQLIWVTNRNSETFQPLTISGWIDLFFSLQTTTKNLALTVKAWRQRLKTISFTFVSYL